MAFCSKCGTQIDTGTKFCPSCGAPVEEPAQQQTQQQENNGGFAATVKNINNTADTTSEFDPADITANKAMGILAYLSWLVLIPLFACKESKFARFHTNQGLTLVITEIAYGVAYAILSAILMAIFPWDWNYGLLGGRGVIYDILMFIFGIVWIVFPVLSIMGIINAANGKAKELPIVGKFKILK